jgi:hypothetical protein
MTINEAIAALEWARAEVGGEAPLLMADAQPIIEFEVADRQPCYGTAVVFFNRWQARRRADLDRADENEAAAGRQPRFKTLGYFVRKPE